MKKLFEYSSPASSGSGNRTILLEYGESFCCWAVWDKQSRSIIRLQYYTFTSEATKNICSVIDTIRHEAAQVNSIAACSFFPQAVLMPGDTNFERENVAAIVYRDKYSVSCTDMIRSKRIVNSYLVPAAVYAAIRKHFPHSPFLHAYTPFLKQVLPATDDISVHFIPGCCKVMVSKKGKLQLAQIYPYNAALDLVYILLKIFQEIGLDKEKTTVHLSGLIERDSALYQELYAYFMNLEFTAPDAVSFEHGHQPPHYFTSIANLATCVS